MRRKWGDVVDIFAALAEVNTLLGEQFKVKSYTTAIHSLRNEERRLLSTNPNNTDSADLTSGKQVAHLPGIGAKLVKKIDEIIKTGKLQELEEMKKLPALVAVQELTKVHGIGPRKAKELFDSHGVDSVAALRSCKAVKLTAAQQVGLRYVDDFQQRIPHEEVKEHEQLLKKVTVTTLGSEFILTVCGSYRRGAPTAGDVDALLSISPHSKDASSASVKTLVSALSDAASCGHARPYVEATLALGNTKFMGVSRLWKPNSLARRIDIRFVSPLSYPTALLYFTGSKRFNVEMRTLAHAKGFTLNEYGLYRTPDESKAASGSGSRGAARTAQDTKSQSEQISESLRVPGILCEKDVFDALGMSYVEPAAR